MSTSGIGVIKSAHSLIKPNSAVEIDTVHNALDDEDEENDDEEIVELEIQLPISTSPNQNEPDPLSSNSSDAFELSTVLHNDKDNNTSLLDSAKPMLDSLLTSASAKTADPTDNASASGEASDSDIEFFEMVPETIEVSDDESHECSELLKNVVVPEKLIETLKLKFKSMFNRIGDSTNRVKDIMIEVPNQTWSLPWKVVSSVYKDPSLDIKLTKRPQKTNMNRRGRKKKSVSNRLKDKYFHNQLLSRIKSEKNSSDNGMVSVLHADSNKSPEFFEFTRFGRLRRKPNRLTDSLTPKLLEKHRPFKKNLTRGIQSIKPTTGPNVIQTRTPDEISPQFKGDSLDNSLSDLDMDDQDSSDGRNRWVAGLSNESDADMLSSTGTSTSSIYNESSNNYNDQATHHNLLEKIRRQELAKHFRDLNKQISFEDGGIRPLAKIKILDNAIDVIRKLEYDLEILRGTKSNLMKYQTLLEYRLQQNMLKIQLNNSIQ